LRRVLILGGSGQVGRALAAAVAAGHSIAAPDSKQLDIADARSVADTFARYRPQLVINAAAYTAVEQAETEPERAFAVNATGAANLARACSAARIPLLQLSTDYVFDGSSATAYNEDDRPNPLNVYGKSKLAGEHEVVASGSAHVILRVSWVFSAVGTNFVKTMLSRATQSVVGVVDDQHGTPCAASDIARVLWLAATRLDLANTRLLLHFASTPPTTWFGFANAIFDRALALGVLQHAPRVEAISTAEYPTRARRPANSLLNATRMQKLLGIEAPDWRESLDVVLRELA
jgi:dTDP-4-dehydrorhamnose reductase